MPDPKTLVHEICSSVPGTGDMTLTNVFGKQPFATAFSTGGTNVFDYYASHRSAAQWERGTAHMGTTSVLVRDTILETVAGTTAKVDFTAGTIDVVNGLVTASTAGRGIIQLASQAETEAQSSTTLAVVPAGLTNFALPIDVRGYISGLVPTNNGTDPTNDVDISAGVAVDTTNAVFIALSSAITKRLDAPWAVGTNQGMLDATESVAGTPDINTWYYLYLIRRSDTGVVDIAASESKTGPSIDGTPIPVAYDAWRMIGAVFNDSAGNVKLFNCRETTGGGLLFYWIDDVLDLDDGAATTETTVTLSVPRLASVQAIISVEVQRPGGSTTRAFIYPIEQDKPTTGQVSGNTNAPNSSVAGVTFIIAVDSNGQINYSVTGTGSILDISTQGFIMARR